MKKFLSCIFTVLLCAITIFSGCDLVKTNSDLYYDQICAKIGNIEINKRQLINAYYNAMQNSGGYYTYAVEDVLDALIDRELVINEVKTNFKKYVEGIGSSLVEEDVASLDNIADKYYYNTAMKKVYEYLDNQILNYENIIRKSKGLEEIKEDTEEAAKTDYEAETVYEKQVEYDEVSKTYKRVVDEHQVETEKIGDYDYRTINHGDDSTRRMAYERFIQSLIRNEEGKGLSTKKEEVLQREIDRVYSETYEKNQYIDIFEKYFKLNVAVDNSLIVDKYKELVMEAYSKLNLEGTEAEIYKAYQKAVSDLTSAQSDSYLYYNPYDNVDGKGYIQVAHILVKFTNEQLEERKQIEDDYLKEVINETEYNDKIALWKAKCAGKMRYTLDNATEENLAGNEYGEAINVQTIYDDYVKDIVSETDLTKRAEAFKNLVYTFSQDPGSLKPSNGNYYYVSLDTSIFDDNNKEAWVKEFADAARNAYNTNGAGSLAEAPVYVESFGEVKEGTTMVDLIDKVIKGESNGYAGYHIIYVVDKCTNLYGNIGEVEGLSEDFAETLYNTRLMLGANNYKTLYDVLYGLVGDTEFEDYRKSVIDTAKSENTITYYEYAYRDLKN